MVSTEYFSIFEINIAEGSSTFNPFNLLFVLL